MPYRSAYHRSKVAKTPEGLAADAAAIAKALAVKAPAAPKSRKKAAETVKEDK